MNYNENNLLWKRIMKINDSDTSDPDSDGKWSVVVKLYYRRVCYTHLYSYTSTYTGTFMKSWTCMNMYRHVCIMFRHVCSVLPYTVQVVRIPDDILPAASRDAALWQAWGPGTSAKWGVHIYDKYAEYRPVSIRHIANGFAYFLTYFLHILHIVLHISCHILHIVCIFLVIFCI